MTNQTILAELTLFIDGASAPGPISIANPSQLIHTGLNLLNNLPASKEAVFEYFYIFFDASVASYVKSHEQRDPNLLASRDSIVGEIQDALEALIIKGNHAWSPFIAMWSIKTLGLLSHKYKVTDNRDIAATCNFWLGSSVMRCLLALTVHCFGKLDTGEKDQFVQQLLSTYMQNNANFDWVVARLGSCFPHKIISEVLACGLRVFVSTNGAGMDSEIGMISYLSFVQEAQLKAILTKLVKEGLNESITSSSVAAHTIPYLFTLCRKSDVILQQMTSVFLDLYDERLVMALIEQLKFWPMAFSGKDMLSTMTSVVLRIRKGATNILLIIADIATTQPWCHNLLEYILLEMAALVSESRQCPPLTDVADPHAQNALIAACVDETLIKCQTAIRLVLLASNQSPYIHHHVVSRLLSNTSAADNMRGIEALIRLISGVHSTNEVSGFQPGVRISLERLLIDEFKMEIDDVSLNSNVLNNLLLLIRLEKHDNCVHLKTSTVAKTLTACESTLIEIAKRYLNKAIDHVSLIDINDIGDIEITHIRPDEHIAKKPKTSASCINRKEKYSNTYRNHIHAVMSLLDILEVGKKDQPLSLDVCIKWAELITKYFFWSSMEPELELRIVAVDRACSLLHRLCAHRKYSRAVALRELIEGALFQYSNLFGVTIDIDLDDDPQQAKTDDRLLTHMNQMQNIGPNIMRSSLHAGMIGSGAKAPARDPTAPKPAFRKMLLKAILACCKQDDISKACDGFTSLASLLVEIISPGVMYNGVAWPEEEFNKVTMERDLQIRRTFKNAPILWSILALIATYRPALCATSVLLRGVCATLLHQWRAKSVLHNQTVDNNQELYEVTRKLLEIMAMGQLLTGPLVYLNVVIEHLEPFEIVVVLKECVWNFMKDNVPTPMQFRLAPNGRYWKDPTVSKPAPQYIDPLRNIMQRKMSKIGTLYYYMFVASELKAATV